ncbi:MAG: SDR family NAD(P)-dependent oxidoreductase [Myxococcota bacterium]
MSLVAVVTGASKGVGKGVALALGSAGATVYLTGRTLQGEGSLEVAAREVEARGGRAIPVRCDHGVDEDVRALAKTVAGNHAHVDILVNNVFAAPSGPVFKTPFWKQPLAMWDTVHQVGLRSHYVASVLLTPLVLKSERGLIANISSFGGASYQVNVAYGVGKAGVDRLARDMAVDLRAHNVCVVSLYPGIVRTERVLAGEYPFDTSNSESPEFTGRAILALSADAERMRHSGKVRVVAELAEEYGFTDVDGSTPSSLRRKDRS